MTAKQQAFYTFTKPVAAIIESWDAQDQKAFKRAFEFARGKGEEFIQAVIDLKKIVEARNKRDGSSITWAQVAEMLGYTSDALDARIRRHLKPTLVVKTTETRPGAVENKGSRILDPDPENTPKPRPEELMPPCVANQDYDAWDNQDDQPPTHPTKQGKEVVRMSNDKLAEHLFLMLTRAVEDIAPVDGEIRDLRVVFERALKLTRAHFQIRIREAGDE